MAYNLARARELRGWSQARAAEEAEPYLGRRLSQASWSAAERSSSTGRLRRFNASELVAFSRTFDLPIGWFLTPPIVAVASDDQLDVVMGGPSAIRAWALTIAARSVDGSAPAQAETYMRLRLCFAANAVFGDVGRAVAALENIVEVLRALEPPDGETEHGMHRLPQPVL